LTVLEDPPHRGQRTWQECRLDLAPLPVPPEWDQQRRSAPVAIKVATRQADPDLPLPLLVPLEEVPVQAASPSCAIRSFTDLLRFYLMELSLAAACVLAAGLAGGAMLANHLGPHATPALMAVYSILFLLKAGSLYLSAKGHSYHAHEARFTSLLIGSLLLAAPHVIALMIYRGLADGS
jgi:hypothetical protein